MARASSPSPLAIKPVLEWAIKTGSVKEVGRELVVEAAIEGESAKELPPPSFRIEEGGEEDKVAR